MALLTFQDVSFQYPNGKKDALSKTSFAVEQGEFILLAGSSGCGKSTLLRQIKPEIAPHGTLTGNILYGEKDIHAMSQHSSASEIGFVAQNPFHQVVTDKVWHELAFGLENLGLSQTEIRIRVSEMASFFGIGDWFDQDTDTLSGGQMQLLNLAAVMAMQPKLLLLDEPTSQLDPIATESFIQTIKKINQDMGVTIVIAEHNLEELFYFADKVGVMQSGKMVAFDTPQMVAQAIYQNEMDTLVLALPTPTAIFQRLGIAEDPPLTIQQGRAFLSRHFANPMVDTLPTVSEGRQEAPMIALKDISFRYGKELADCLSNLSFCVYKGEILSIVGENGTGKSTLLSVIASLLVPYRGSLKIDGKAISKGKKSDLIGMLPQDPQSVFLMETVLADLQNACQDQMKIEKMLQKLSLSHLKESHPYDLSGGEQQRVALAKVLLQEPQILLLDEPTKGIDSVSKQTLGAFLRELSNEGVTVVTVTHDIEFAAQFSDQCAMLFHGEIVSQNEPRSFFGNHSFYTTVANKMSRHLYHNAVTKEDVITLCQMNMQSLKGEG